MTEQMRATEAEQRKILAAAVEKGMSRPTSAPIRPAAESPNQLAILQERQRNMKELESQYAQDLSRLKDKMDRREPLFRLEKVEAAFEEMRKRQAGRRQQLTEEEHQQWEHLRSLE